jgi:hypothetical protein
MKAAFSPRPVAANVAPNPETSPADFRPAEVLKPTDTLMGKTGPEVTLERWAWKFRHKRSEAIVPEGQQPNIVKYQRGDVWFLEPYKAFEDPQGEHHHPTQVWNVDVPEGKALAVPLIGAIYFNGSMDPPDYDERAARADADQLQKDIISQVAWVDGVPVPSDMLNTQQLSPGPWPKIGPMPEEAMFEVPEGEDISMIAQGSQLMIPPPSPGLHTIRLVARDTSGFAFDITYNVNVVPGMPGPNPEVPDNVHPPEGMDRGTTMYQGQYADNALGLAFFWNKSNHRQSEAGTVMNENEVNRAIVQALTDSTSPGVIDEGERRVFTEGFARLSGSMTTGARATYEALFADGPQGTLSADHLRKLIGWGVNPASTAGRQLTDDELHAAIVSAMVNGALRGEIDENERAAINATMGNLPSTRVPIDSFDGGEPDPLRKAAPSAEYAWAMLQRAGVL